MADIHNRVAGVVRCKVPDELAIGNRIVVFLLPALDLPARFHNCVADSYLICGFGCCSAPRAGAVWWSESISEGVIHNRVADVQGRALMSSRPSRAGLSEHFR